MLVILDKDGTLVQPKLGAEFVQSPEDQELLPGVADRISELAAAKHNLIIASNQGGVAAGYKTLEDAVNEMKYCMSLLPSIELGLLCSDAGETCHRVRRHHLERIRAIVPYTSNTKVCGNFRKPSPGMLNFAVNYGLLPSDSHCFQAFTKQNAVMIGDRPEDEQAAANAGIRFLWADQWREGTAILEVDPIPVAAISQQDVISILEEFPGDRDEALAVLHQEMQSGGVIIVP